MERKKGNGGIYPIEKGGAIPTPSRQLEKEGYGDIKPVPLDPDKLIEVVEQSESLGNYIGAMATNIALFGYGIRWKADFDYNQLTKDNPTLKAEADAEWNELNLLYKHIAPFDTLEQILYKAMIDKYTIGWGTVEVIRDTLGTVAEFVYCRSADVRIVPTPNNFATVKIWQENENGIYEQNEINHKFKKFVQIVDGIRVYFKEFGDPRPMDSTNGNYAEWDEEKKEYKPVSKYATELIFLSTHNPASDYGLPPWIGTLPNALGSRYSELLNLKYFQNGKIIPVAITVTNGYLTKESNEALINGKGIDAAHGWLVLETVSDDNVVSDGISKRNTTIDIKPLTDAQNKDALFTDYQEKNREKHRRNFRIAPIYTGDSTDYNRATADTAREITEEQVFVPAREEVTRAINVIVNNELGIKYCELYLKGPQISNEESKAKALDTYIKAGAVTPNMVIPVLEKLLNITLEKMPPEIGDLPFALVQMQYQAALQQKGNTSEIQKEMSAADAFFGAVEDLREFIEKGGK